MRLSNGGYIDYELNDPRRDYNDYPVHVSNEKDPYNEQQEIMVEPEHSQMPETPMLEDNPYNGAVFPGKDEGFLKWLFNFRKEAIIPLLNVWRGREFNFTTNKWEDSENGFRIMNAKGISWGISLIESFMNPSFIVTDLDEETYCFRMRSTVRVIWRSLCLRHKEFDLKKSDIHRVAEEIESKVSAILRGALDNGYRDFFSTQNQNIEHRTYGQHAQIEPKRSMWSGAADMFRRTGIGGR